MNRTIRRVLLAGASIIFGVGGFLHTGAFFSKAAAVIDSSGVKVFFDHELKVLWLADSTTLISLALICGYLAFRPHAVTRTVLILLALVPASTTALLYGFLGSFYAAHLLMIGTAMVFGAGLTGRADDTTRLEKTFGSA